MKITMPLTLLISTLLLLLSTGCSEEDNESTTTPFNWTISGSNADNVVKQIFSYQDSESTLSNTIASDPTTDLKSAQNKLITTDTPLPCNVSGSLSSTFTGDFFGGDFSWTMTFNACNSGDNAGPVNGSITITSALDSVSGDVTGTIGLNLTSQGFTIVGAVNSTTDGNTSSQTSTFNLTITASTGTLTVVTNTPFVQNLGDLYPSAGQLVVTGPNNGKIRVTALTGGSVQIEVDADGIAGYEISVTKLWTDL